MEAVLSLVRDSRCYGCGGQISDVLAKLGSALCHDCRDRAAATGCAPERSLSVVWARMEIDSYLRVWRAQHGDAGVAVLDGESGKRETSPEPSQTRVERRTARAIASHAQ